MAYRFTARAIAGVFDPTPGQKSYEETEGSFTIIGWPDGSSRFGAPAALDWLSPAETLPDVLNLPYLCLSERARSLIESLEPGVHHFYPVRIRLANGQQESRHLLHVSQAFDAVSSEHSKWVQAPGPSWRPPPTREKRLVFDSRAIGSRHLWHNEGLGTEMRYMASDALADAAKAAGLTGLLLDHFDQTNGDGSYTAPALSPDRVYQISDRTRLRAGGLVPLTVKIKLIDGKPNAIRLDGDPAGATTHLAAAMNSGRRIDPTNVPTRAYYYQSAKGVPPDIYQYGELPLTVSERMKALIDALEPDVHQFIRLTLVDKKHAPIEQRYLFVIGGVLDAGSRAHSSILGDRIWRNPGGEQGHIMIDRAAVAGRHAWRDLYLPGGLFVSNQVAQEIENRGWPDLQFTGYDLAG